MDFMILLFTGKWKQCQLPTHLIYENTTGKKQCPVQYSYIEWTTVTYIYRILVKLWYRTPTYGSSTHFFGLTPRQTILPKEHNFYNISTGYISKKILCNIWIKHTAFWLLIKVQRGGGGRCLTCFSPTNAHICMQTHFENGYKLCLLSWNLQFQDMAYM